MDKAITNNYKWKGLFAILVGTFSVLLSLCFLFPASPIIMKDFNVDIESVSWLTLLYAISSSVFGPILGKTGDIFGRKKNVLIGLVIFTIAQALAAISPNLIMISVARFIQGIGAAAVMPIGMAFISENFLKHERGKALGIWSMVISAAPAIGPILGGHMINWFGWRSIFWISGILGIISFLVIHFSLKESKKQSNERIDFIGSLLLLFSVSSLIVFANKVNTWGWFSNLSISFFAIFSILIILFFFVEKKIKYPLIDLNFIKSPIFIFSSLTGFIAFLIFQGSFFLIPFFLQHIQHYLPSETGLVILPLSISLMISSYLIGKLTDKMSIRFLTMLGMIVVAVSIYFLSLIRIDVSFFKISLILGILGFGIGSTFPTMSKAISNSAPISKIGSTVGSFNMIRTLGGPFGVAIAATIFANKMNYYLSIENQKSISSLNRLNLPFYEIGLALFTISILGILSAFFVKADNKASSLQEN